MEQADSSFREGLPVLYRFRFDNPQDSAIIDGRSELVTKRIRITMSYRFFSHTVMMMSTAMPMSMEHGYEPLVRR